MKKYFAHLFLCFFALLSISASNISFAATPEPPAVPKAYVVDLAGIIQQEYKTRLTAYLKELEQKTGAQVVILTIQSLEGEDMVDFAQRTFEKWKLGQKEKNNGLLIVVALKDRKYRFHTGYGLEEILPDSKLGSIGRDYLVPDFRKGDYSGGIFKAALVVIKTIAESQGVEITGMPKLQRAASKQYRNKDIPWPALIFIILIPALFFFLFLRKLKDNRFGGHNSGTWGGGYGGGFGGGFGGGGDSGFGGGGGDSGGGGAGGDW